MEKILEFIKDKYYLSKLKKKKLQSYYKEIVNIRNNFYNSITCDDCGLPTWQIDPNDKDFKRYKEIIDIIDAHIIEINELLKQKNENRYFK